MNATLQKIFDFCEREVANGSIYVWGSEGQSAITEKWIRSSETSTENANRAIALWTKRMAAGFKNIRAFDCSGYVSCGMMVVGLMSGRRDCDGLWARCTKIGKAENGALLFRVNKKDPEDETHVGFYFNGFQYHAKGRDDGVVKEPYNASYWKKIGWFKTLPHDTDAEIINEEAEIDPPYVLVVGNRVNVRVAAGAENKKLFTASKDDKFPLGEIDDDTKWYAIETPHGLGFISGRKDLTKLVTE